MQSKLSQFFIFVCLCFHSSLLLAQRADRYEPLRDRMVDEFIIPEGVTDPGVVHVMRTVPRHLFVKPGTQNMAYFDQAVDIGYGQTISPPFIVAYMTQTLDPQPTDRVLEIGTGSGYQAAVLSGLVQEVYTIEIVEQLGKRAASVLKRNKYENVFCKIGDGYQGWAEHAPFDKIIVTCSPENVPQPLVDQLVEGGKLLIPLGERYQQVFYLYEKKNGQLESQRLIPTLFVPMTGRMEELRQVQPNPLNPQLVNGNLEVLVDGEIAHWHYQRQATPSEDAYEGEYSILFENQDPGRLSHMLQALPVDGTQVRQFRVNWAMKTEETRSGETVAQAPAIHFYFYDQRRLPMGRVTLGPYRTHYKDWREFSETVDIPVGARDVIMQIGLCGGVGKMWVDAISVTPVLKQ